MKNNYNITNLLLECGADPNLKDLNGNTALNYTLLKINYNHEYDYFKNLFSDHLLDGRINKNNIVKFNSNVYENIELLLSYGAKYDICDKNNIDFQNYVIKSIKIIKDSNDINNLETELETFEVIIGCLCEPVTYSIYYLFKIRPDTFEEHILPKIPPEYLCPISKYPLLDPCIASDGYSYCRKSILTHMDYSESSPVTKEKFENSKLTQNFVLKSMVYEYVQKLVNEYFKF